VSLNNHTALKPIELLRAKAHACLADGGAFVFIDAIDPVGTLNPMVYERMGKVFAETQIYEPYLGGELCQDVAIYLSLESKFDPADNGKAVDDPQLSSKTPHIEAAVSACKALLDAHIPYGVVTRRNLKELSRHQILILPNLLMMDEEEAEAFRAYVRAGGIVYASGVTSLVTTDGVRHGDFLLGDLFGVTYLGETAEAFTYIAPAVGAEKLFPEHSSKYPLGLPNKQMIVRARPGTEILGWMVLPYTDPADPTRYASIHSNPPGLPTENPGVVLNHFGAGKALYVTTDLERYDTCHNTFIALIRNLAKPFSFEADAPKAVEVTVFKQEDKGRYLVSLINFQKELPNIPVEGIRLRLRMDGKDVKRVLILPAERELDYRQVQGYVEFTAPKLETFAMFAVEYI
jgi:hypothetical protein